ncbi:Uncharacterized protein SCF082_LOCUS3397 [Durusdinium trenchii]|uniref:Uncharacterized protein n=1 Tax=Durusdinium trenchii TaxID=1381693 RepID=A0ABP0HUS5_9DINO
MFFVNQPTADPPVDPIVRTVAEASSWPFGALDLRANRDQLRRWLNSSQWVAGCSAVATRSDLATAAPLFRSSPFTGLQEPAAALVVPTEAGWRRGAGHMNRWQASRLLGLVVFGVHSTLVLEPATMLKAALRFWQVQVRIFMRDCPRGNDAWAHHCTLQCHALGECAPSSQGSAQLFVDLVHMFEEAIHERSSYYKVGDYLEVISQMHQIDPELRRSELYVCTAPLMCSLLRAVVEKPLLAYLGMQLHVHVDRQIDQLWLMHFQAMVRDVQSNVWAVHNFAMREQIRYATNVELEVVRPRALYALGTGYSKYGRPQRSPKRSREVLFFRSSYFRLSLFVKVLEARAETTGPTALAGWASIGCGLYSRLVNERPVWVLTACPCFQKGRTPHISHTHKKIYIPTSSFVCIVWLFRTQHSCWGRRRKFL